MAEGDRLRDLQVGEAGHDRVGVPVGEVEQGAPQRFDLRRKRVDLAAQPQPHVGRDLVVARTRRVQPLAGVAHQLGQAFLDGQVDVLVGELPREFAAPDLPGNRRQPALDGFEIGFRQDPGAREHPRMGARSRDIDGGQPLVERDRGVEAPHALGHRFREAAGPGAVLRQPGGRRGSVLGIGVGRQWWGGHGCRAAAGYRFGAAWRQFEGIYGVSPSLEA